MKSKRFFLDILGVIPFEFLVLLFSSEGQKIMPYFMLNKLLRSRLVWNRLEKFIPKSFFFLREYPLPPKNVYYYYLSVSVSQSAVRIYRL